MPDLKWNVLLTRPWTALKIFFSGSWRSILVLLGRIVFPFRARRLSLRTQLVRAWVIAAHFTDSDAFCSEPWGHRCQEVTFETPLVAGVDGPGHGDNGDASEGSHTTTAPTTTAASSPNRPKDVGGWIIPTTNFGELKNKDAILMYAHGGGYAIGHGLQNLSDFQRWIRKAKPFGQEWAVVSVKYPLSTEKKWPAQRNAFLRMYKWLLDQEIPATKIVFSGTSAGGGLILSAMLYIQDHTDLPQPRCAVAHSPWTDVTSSLTNVKEHPLYASDYLFNYNQSAKMMNDLVRPPGEPFDTPEISPVLATDVSGLPPQLIFWGDAEVLRTDSTRWIARSRDAGVRIHEHIGKGQMHTFSTGPQLSGNQVADECDDILLNFVITELAPPI